MPAGTAWTGWSARPDRGWPSGSLTPALPLQPLRSQSILVLDGAEPRSCFCPHFTRVSCSCDQNRNPAALFGLNSHISENKTCVVRDITKRQTTFPEIIRKIIVK